MSHSTVYRPLPQTNVAAAGCYVLEAFNPPKVDVDSAAVLAMTDLARVPSATITPDAALEQANQSMILRGVRLLLVVGEGRRVAGVITSADVLGEKPVLVAQGRRIKRNDLCVSDLMVPVDAMEVLNIEDVRKASVGNIVATLKAAGRAHALVVGQADDGKQSLLGIFSASQIARQLGVQIQTHEMARTFAEIEAVIARV
ncbi:MAG: CBS domain-containing protein [Rhodocyclaceae bacterium]|jgi:CBS-domain-containing membrane protein|nr:CBS domain-containing protein [Rhodocyclaceae bacterium]